MYKFFFKKKSNKQLPSWVVFMSMNDLNNTKNF